MTLDQWLSELTAVDVEVRGRAPFTLQVDLAALSLARYDQVQAALKDAKDATKRVALLAEAVGEVAKGWTFAEPVTPEQLARLGEVPLYYAWDKITDFLLPPAPATAPGATP